MAFNYRGEMMSDEEQAEWDELFTAAKPRKGYAFSPAYVEAYRAAQSEIDGATREAIPRWPTHAEIKHTRQTQRESAFDIYVNAQRSDVPGSIMTMTEKHLASIEWSERLRAKVKASDDETKRKEREQVVCDLQWID